MQYEVSFGTDVAHRPISFEISSVSCSEKRIFQSTNNPTRERISVPGT
jgi:hypothetical protein